MHVLCYLFLARLLFLTGLDLSIPNHKLPLDIAVLQESSLKPGSAVLLTDCDLQTRPVVFLSSREKKDVFVILCVCVSCLYVCLCTTYVPDAHQGETEEDTGEMP